MNENIAEQLQQLDTEKTEVKAPSMSTLTDSDCCTKKAELDRLFEGMPIRDTEKGQIYYRTIILKDTIKNALRNQIRDPKDIMQYMASRYPEIGYENYQQQQARLLFDHKRVMRYLNAEQRFPSFPKGKNIAVGCKTKFVHPDIVFDCGPSAEAVWYKMRQNRNMTQNPKKPTFDRYMQLYAGILYLREQGYKNIKASYYYLEKTTDRYNFNECDQSFFGSADNIITTEDIYLGSPTELDEEMKPYLTMMEEGVDPASLDEKKCRYCIFHEMCGFTRPPQKGEEE